MRTSLFIVVNPVGSKFAKALQDAVRKRTNKKILRVRQPRPGRNNFIVTPNVLDKIRQLEAFARNGVHCPPFATTIEGAKQFTSKTIFARTLINSTNGRGILEFGRDDVQYPIAPLYTAYIPKKKEYRLHVFGNEVIDIQEKRKKRGFENDRDTRVRNLHNGYVYCRDGIYDQTGVKELAVSAVRACGYSYGAVDIIYNEKLDKCFVLEVNSRPGLMGTTLDKYTDALIRMFNL